MDRVQNVLEEIRAGLEGFGIDTPLGIGLLVVGAFVVLKAAKLIVKLAMLPVIAAGLYLWLGG